MAMAHANHTGKGQDATAGHLLQISSAFGAAGAASHPGHSAKKQVFRASSAPLTAELYFCTPQHFPAWHSEHPACCLAFQYGRAQDVHSWLGYALASSDLRYMPLSTQDSDMLKGLQERSPTRHERVDHTQQTLAFKADLSLPLQGHPPWSILRARRRWRRMIRSRLNALAMARLVDCTGMIW
ncbi:hypothetical protein LTR15_012465 [Elasticomyces elasticus]|nr:hypothetical protein LTR15_012465 [Elasticomyces elasticus]